MPGFAKAKSFYEKEFPPNSKKHWPYDAPIAEAAHNRWLDIVVDPSNDEYYKSSTGEQPKYTIRQIVRVKGSDGEEFLYSIGAVKGFNMFGDPVITGCNAPESYEQAIFTHETLKDERDGHNKRFTTGIAEKIKKYDLPWNADNVDKLWNMKDPKGCMLTVKEESSGRVKECKSLEMFKTKPFDYILNDEWQSVQEKEIAVREYEVSQGKSHKR